jgi:hypothetical protein
MRLGPLNGFAATARRPATEEMTGHCRSKERRSPPWRQSPPPHEVGPACSSLAERDTCPYWRARNGSAVAAALVALGNTYLPIVLRAALPLLRRWLIEGVLTVVHRLSPGAKG